MRDAALPGFDATDLDWAIFEQDAVLTRAQAVELVGAARARRMVVTGRWRSLCRGLISAHNGPLTNGAQLWVAVLAAGPGAVLAGLTAAVEAGLKGFRSRAIDVLVPGARAYTMIPRRLPPEMPAVVVHRTSALPERHIQRARPVRTVTARAIVDAAQWARGDDEARAIVAAACQQRLVTPAEVLTMLDAMPRARRRGVTTATSRDAEGGATSLGEIDLVRLCKRYGLPVPELQERRTDASGRVRYLDAYWRRYHLHVEVDGAHHMDVRQWEADMVRQNDVWIRGDRILRFSAWQVRRQPEAVARVIATALRGAGWRG